MFIYFEKLIFQLISKEQSVTVNNNNNELWNLFYVVKWLRMILCQVIYFKIVLREKPSHLWPNPTYPKT